MKFEELRKLIRKNPIFTFEDVLMLFPDENYANVKLLLHNWTRTGKLNRIKKGLYCLADIDVSDNYFFAAFIYSPSYISLESALNYYGIIPDIPQEVVSVTTNNTQEFNTVKGVYLYRKISNKLFYGFKKVQNGSLFYLIADKEKAVLDYLYYKSRGIYTKNLDEIRLTFDDSFDWNKFIEYSKDFNLPATKRIIEKFIKMYE